MNRRTKPYEDLEHFLEMTKDLDVFKGDEGRALLACYQRGILDGFVIDRIRWKAQRAFREFKEEGGAFLPPQLCRGDFVFGLDRHGRRLLTFIQFLNAHTLIVAGTGAGKTTLSKLYALQIACSVKGMWLIDLRKREYRALRPLLAQMGIDLKVIRDRKLCINVLQVPLGVEPIRYAAAVADLLVSALGLPPRASTLLRTTIIRLYRAHEIMDGGRQYPTVLHLCEAIRSDRNANAQARQAALDQLEAVLEALGPEVLGYHCGWAVHELAKQHLAIELDALPPACKHLVLGYLLTAEFMSRIARGASNPKMDLWIAFDEGQRLLAQHQEAAGNGENPILDLLGLIRGTGIGIQASVLGTHGLSPKVVNLTGTKIVGRLGSISEYTTAGRYIGLSPEQITWCAHHMVPGLFVGQLAEGPWRRPFLFRSPSLLQSHTVDANPNPACDNSGGTPVGCLPPA